MNNPSLHIILAIGLAAIILLGSIPPTASADEEDIVLNCAIKPLKTKNPFNADADDWKVLNLIYEGATKKDPETGELVPYIAVGTADSMDFNMTWADCTVGEFAYTPESTWDDPAKPEMVVFYDFGEVHWHDGERMTVRDIMFTFHALQYDTDPELGQPLADLGGDPAGNYSEDRWLFINKVWESMDGSRAALKFTLQKPYYTVFEHYLSAPIFPYHIWGGTQGYQAMNNTRIWCDRGYAPDDIYSWSLFLATKALNARPVGSGPFKWAGDGYDCFYLVPWDRHFYKPGFKYYSVDQSIRKQPGIDRLSLRVYHTDEMAVMDLESGKIDMISWDLPQVGLAELAGNEDIKIQTLGTESFYYLGFNMRHEFLGYDWADGKGKDSGKPLRMAISHCLDRETMAAASNIYSMEEAVPWAMRHFKNHSAPSRLFDPTEAINILSDAGYKLEEPGEPPGENNTWKNPDGTEISSAPGQKLRLLVLGYDHDKRVYTMGTMIVSQLNEIGIATELFTSNPKELEQSLDQREFDMVLAKEVVSGILGNGPENYLFSKFHSANSWEGPNHFGYDNASFDTKAEEAIGSPGIEVRKNLVHDMAAILAYDVPIEMLYTPVNTEIYRLDNFHGFVDDGSGSLLNPRSMASVRPQEKNSLHSRFIGLPLTIISNLSTPFRVKVVDRLGAPVEDVYIQLETDSGQLLNLSGQTNEHGQFTSNFTAPYVPLREEFNNWEQVTIRVRTASIEDYRPAPDISWTMIVIPDKLRYLAVHASVAQDVFTDTDSSGNAGFTYLDILVTDSRMVPVEGASITVQSLNSNIAVSENDLRADQDGRARVVLTSRDIDDMTECPILVNASKERFKDASINLTITVHPYVEQHRAEEVIWEPWIAVIGLGGLASLVAVMYHIQRKR